MFGRESNFKACDQSLSVADSAAISRQGVFLPADNPTFGNPDFESASLRILIVRLSPFRDVDRSTPHYFLACEVRNAMPNAFVDMVFFPAKQDRSSFAENKTDWMTGVQSLRSGREFDVILISNSFVLELINLPSMLRRSGLPVWASERGEVRPLILMGGSNAMAAQAIIRDDGDCMADAIFFGEGEGRVGRMLKGMAGESRKGRLDSLKHSGLPGLWVAGSFPERLMEKAVLESPAVGDIAVRYPVLNSGEASTGRLQISYGCPAFCSFCFEGYDRKPYREIKLDDIVSAAGQLKRNHGCRDVDLYSFNFNTYTELVPLLTALHRLFATVNFKSQRVDILSENPGLLQMEIAAGKSSFTLGIEGISERCRAMLHKSLPGAVVNSLIERMFREKIRELKLFYILTGHENAEDVAEFSAFVRKCKACAMAHNRGIRLIFSFGMLVRMPGTPLQFDVLKLDYDAWRQLSGEIESICSGAGFEYRMATTWQEYAVSQVMALGGYWLWRPIVELDEKGGFYDGRLPAGYWNNFKEWMEQNGEWTEELVGKKDKDYPFALSFVGSRINKAFLYDQYLHAMSYEDGGYCLGRVSGKGTCLNCGACVDNEDRARITAKRAQIDAGGGALEKLTELVKTKARMSAGLIIADIPVRYAGVTDEWLNAAVMRQLLNMFPDEMENILAVQELLFTAARSKGGVQIPLYGETVFGVKAWNIEKFIGKLQAASHLGEITFRVPAVMVQRSEPVRLKSVELRFLCRSDNGVAPDRELAEFMRSQHISFTLRRMESEYRMEITGKKRDLELISECAYSFSDEGCYFRLTVGPRFELDMLRRCFKGNGISSCESRKLLLL